MEYLSAQKRLRGRHECGLTAEDHLTENIGARRSNAILVVIEDAISILKNLSLRFNSPNGEAVSCAGA